MKTLTTIILMLCMTLSLHAQDQGLQEAAIKAFGELKALAALKDVKMPNMPTPEMLASARLGEVIPHTMIRLDRLQQYSSGTDPKSMIENLDRVTVPVIGRETEVISAVELDRTQGQWRSADLNNAAYVKEFDRVRKDNNLKLSECTLVRVPAFNLYFLAINASRGFELALLSDKAFNEIPPRRFVPANDVMTQLNTVAKNYNGLPW